MRVERLKLNRRESLYGLHSFLLEDLWPWGTREDAPELINVFHHKCPPPRPPHWVVTFLKQATNNFRANKKVLTQNFFVLLLMSSYFSGSKLHFFGFGSVKQQFAQLVGLWPQVWCHMAGAKLCVSSRQLTLVCPFERAEHDWSKDWFLGYLKTLENYVG